MFNVSNLKRKCRWCISPLLLNTPSFTSRFHLKTVILGMKFKKICKPSLSFLSRSLQVSKALFHKIWCNPDSLIAVVKRFSKNYKKNFRLQNFSSGFFVFSLTDNFCYTLNVQCTWDVPTKMVSTAMLSVGTTLDLRLFVHMRGMFRLWVRFLHGNNNIRAHNIMLL